MGGGSATNNARITNGTSINVSGATDSQYNGLVGSPVNSPNAALNVNGVDSTGISAGSGNFSGTALRFCRANAAQIGANITEGWFYTGGLNATNRGNLYANMHGVNGYNGAFKGILYITGGEQRIRSRRIRSAAWPMLRARGQQRYVGMVLSRPTETGCLLQT